jgi:hypothetical protein
MTACAAVAAIVLTAAGGLAQAASCRSQLGAAKAAALADQCRQVSPATHPPCNVDNPCDMIIGEIKRGCGFFTPGSSPPAPDFCRRY